MAAGRTSAALGFRAHSGWAAVVAVAGTVRAPEVLDRRRIQIADSGIPGSMQPYHAAEGLPLPKARALLQRCEAGSTRLAQQAVGEILDSLKARGHTVAACGLVLSSGRPLPELASILASHAIIHTADGEHFRDAIVLAVTHHRLPVTRIKEREIAVRAAAKLRMPVETLPSRLTAIGKPLGPPWTQDQKLAALAAWLALSGG